MESKGAHIGDTAIDDFSKSATAQGGVRAICFDAFGTLVEITDKRRPFRALLTDRPFGDLTNAVLTQPLNLCSVTELLPTELDKRRMIELELDLQAEIGSIHLRPAIDQIWKRLRGEGLVIRICFTISILYDVSSIAYAAR